jgi:glucokinase
MKKRIAIGVDVGGSHISCALVDINAIEILDGSMQRSSYDHTSDKISILKNWSDTIEKTIQSVPLKDEIQGIGFAFPGPFNYSEGIAMMTHKMKALYGLNLTLELSKHLTFQKQLDMRYINDATCFAIGEAFMGKGKEGNKLTVITLGTGLGSAFLDNKVPVIHREDTPEQGCLWHLPYSQGIADEYFSTTWFKKKYYELTSKEIAGVKELVFDNKKDPHVKDIFETFGNNLGTFLSPYLTNFQTDTLIVGGNISKALDHFIAPLTKNLRTTNPVDIIKSDLLEDAAVIGAAILFDSDYWEKVSKILPDL